MVSSESDELDILYVSPVQGIVFRPSSSVLNQQRVFIIPYTSLPFLPRVLYGCAGDEVSETVNMDNLLKTNEQRLLFSGVHVGRGREDRCAWCLVRSVGVQTDLKYLTKPKERENKEKRRGVVTLVYISSQERRKWKDRCIHIYMYVLNKDARLT